MRTITAEWLRLRWVILERDDFTCQYCGRRAPEVQLQVDHRVPVVENGTDAPENLVTACYSCNQGKEYSRWTLANPAAAKQRSPRAPAIRAARQEPQCAVCGTPGADMIGWIYPSSGYREDGGEAPVHRACLSNSDDRDAREGWDDE